MSAFRFRRQAEDFEADLLPPERRPSSYSHPRFPASPDVVDAEFITVIEAPRRSFDARRFNDNRRDSIRNVAVTWPSEPDRGLVGMVLACERFLARLTTRDFATLLCAIVLFVFILAGTLAVGPLGPGPSRPALDITHISLTPGDADGMRMLVVNAIVENRSGTVQALPPVRADLVSDGTVIGSVVIHPPVSRIAGGESHGLQARLQHPGGKTPELKLSFMNEAVASF
ncbi:DUF3426 domain-containing protein [Pseudomonas sp. R2.Fl]|nr:DUF3426 domain-containing protein [Pseudomonas sp. R2.Fl]